MDQIRELPDGSVDSIVTDPPYELGFMGRTWDSTGIAYSVPMWNQSLRVLKPGGHMLAFGGSRTYHRMACAIEDAGFEIRDQIMWIYGSGFPKSLDVSKALDKVAGADRSVTGSGRGRTGTAAQPNGGSNFSDDNYQWPGEFEITSAATDAAKQWDGWGTALKPAHEPIVVARKPLVGTVAANVLKHGTGALNIDRCRIEWPLSGPPQIGTSAWGGAAKKLTAMPGQDGPTVERQAPSELGRWPANVIHDGSDEVLRCFPNAPGQQADVTGEEPSLPAKNVYGKYRRVASRTRVGEGSANARYATKGSTNFAALPGERRLDTGTAARFFYCAKADREERNRGCESLGKKPLLWSSGTQSPGTFQAEGTDRSAQNNHPTVKPVDLMAYLCRLVTPPGGTVLDMFTGSGSTGIAALRGGFHFIGIERNPEYVQIARLRIEGDAPLLNKCEELL